MAKKKKIFKKRYRDVQAPESCFFCDEKRDPDVKFYEDLAKFMSERGKIFAKERSGLCAKHQRGLAVAIKQARYLGLLPYTPGI